MAIGDVELSIVFTDYVDLILVPVIFKEEGRDTTVLYRQTKTNGLTIPIVNHVWNLRRIDTFNPFAVG